MLRFRGSGKTPQEIARELGAEYAVSGTVRWALYLTLMQFVVGEGNLEVFQSVQQRQCLGSLVRRELAEIDFMVLDDVVGLTT